MSNAPSPNDEPNDEDDYTPTGHSEDLDKEIETPDGEQTSIGEVVADIVVAHKEIEAYKNGALALSQSLDEAIMEYELRGDDSTVEVLEDLKESAYGVYLRIKRGDDELLGHRDGKFSGYFADDEDAGAA